MRWLLPHGFLIEWSKYSDLFSLQLASKNYLIRLQHPDSFMTMENWIEYVEKAANVSPGTFIKGLGEFYGEYRKTRTPIYGNTYQSPNQSAGGSYGYANQSTLGQAQLAAYAAAQANAYSQYNSLTAMGMPGTVPQPALGSGPSTITPPHSPTLLKSEGIRAGEIIAWRGWVIDGDDLCSCVASCHWNSTEPMSGDPAAGYGIHAYKGPHGPLLDGYVQKGMGQWVIGEVALWGDIIEHEDGYRAEFARVHSLVTWSESISPSVRQIITEKYITSQPVYKIDDSAEGEDDGMPVLPRSHRKET